MEINLREHDHRVGEKNADSICWNSMKLNGLDLEETETQQLKNSGQPARGPYAERRIICRAERLVPAQVTRNVG